MKKKLIQQESGEFLESEVMKSVTIDGVIFAFINGSLQVLLVKHAKGISEGK